MLLVFGNAIRYAARTSRRPSCRTSLARLYEKVGRGRPHRLKGLWVLFCISYGLVIFAVWPFLPIPRHFSWVWTPLTCRWKRGAKAACLWEWGCAGRAFSVIWVSSCVSLGVFFAGPGRLIFFRRFSLLVFLCFGAPPLS